MSIARGTFLGPYEILDLVGSGGMGEVYHARDRRLGRSVAIKILPSGNAIDRERVTRFEREARLASFLNHPNIITIYDIGEENSIPFMAMELVKGKTLREISASGPIPLRQALAIAVQIADALAKAHESGIVHRDLKPENVMVTDDGIVKILDFGLGKNSVLPIATAQSTILAQPDVTSPGTILGTADYMSPEQAAGRDTDFRSDQFSLGSILYEMTTGKRAFRRDSVVQTMSAIIQDPVTPASVLNPSVPARLGEIINRCLEKNPDQRYHATRELVRELRELSAFVEVSSSGLLNAVPEPTANRRRRFPLAHAAALAAVLLVAAILLIPSLRRALLNGTVFPEPLPPSKNLVVLPFRAAVAGADNERFAAGLTEAITTALVQLTIDPSLQMSPSSEVASRHITTADEARTLLSANLVVAGRVERSGETISVTWTMENPATHHLLRSRTIRVRAPEELELESRTIESLIGAMDLRVSRAQKQALISADTPIPAARDAYLRGRGYLQEYDKEENISHAIALFEEALRLAPDYARAYAGLGEAYWRRYQHSRTADWIDPARSNCLKAVSLNASLADGHGCLGMVYFGIGRYDEAIKEYRRALEIEPTNDNFTREVARVEERLGRIADAENTLKQAVQLRPQYWANYSVLGSFYFNQARYREAAEMFAQVVRLAPDTSFGYSNLGGAYVKLGRYADAIPMFERSVAIRPTGPALSNLATTYFQRRRFLEAAQTFERAVQIDGKNYALWGNLADAYYWAAGKRDLAPDAYRKAIALGEDALKVNARDAILLSRIGLYHAMLNDRSMAFAYLNRALEIAPGDAEVRYKAALIHNQFKDVEKTLDWLEKAAEAGYSITTIRDVRNFDHLWSYPRFQNLLRKY